MVQVATVQSSPTADLIPVARSARKRRKRWQWWFCRCKRLWYCHWRRWRDGWRWRHWTSRHRSRRQFYKRGLDQRRQWRGWRCARPAASPQGGTATNGLAGTIGSGGVGVLGAGLTLINSGTISGGLAGDGNVANRANAISFLGGTNTLVTNGGSYTGGISIAATNGGNLIHDQTTTSGARLALLTAMSLLVRVV